MPCLQELPEVLAISTVKTDLHQQSKFKVQGRKKKNMVRHRSLPRSLSVLRLKTGENDAVIIMLPILASQGLSKL